LFLTIEPEVTQNNDKLTDERNPEQWQSHWAPYDIRSEIRRGIEKNEKPFSPSPKSHFAASGKTELGPTALGAVARATMTQIDPII